jgi:WD40 repeat protein
MARLLCLVLLAGWLPAPAGWASEPLRPETTLRLTPLQSGRDAPVVTAIAVDPRGEWLAVAGDDHAIRVLALADWRLVKVLDLHQDWVRDLQFSPDGRLLVSVANDGKLLFWERDNGWRSVEGLGEAPALRAVRFSPGGDLVAAVGFAPEVLLVGVEDTRRPKLRCGCRDLRSVAFRSDGQLLAAAGRSGDLHFYDAVTGSTLGDVQLHSRRVNAVLFIEPTGRTVSAGEDGHVVLYDPAEQRVVRDIHIPGTMLRTACLLSPQIAAVAGTDNTIYLVDLQAGEVIDALDGHSGSIATLACHDGRLFSGSFDTTLRAWPVGRLIGASQVAGTEAATVPEARTSRKP